MLTAVSKETGKKRVCRAISASVVEGDEFMMCRRKGKASARLY